MFKNFFIYQNSLSTDIACQAVFIQPCLAMSLQILLIFHGSVLIATCLPLFFLCSELKSTAHSRTRGLILICAELIAYQHTWLADKESLQMMHQQHQLIERVSQRKFVCGGILYILAPVCVSVWFIKINERSIDGDSYFAVSIQLTRVQLGAMCK